MTVQPFRFIHAADLHIESPVNGLSRCPAHLEDRILDAPRAAAQRLFRCALDEKVDFIVLSGDVVDPRITGPWGLLFLIEEFQKLEKEGIQVYWAGGKVDPPDEIPSAFQFPANVHFFSIDKTDEFFFSRNDQQIVRILGTSAGKKLSGFRPPEQKPEENDLFTICVYYGKILPETVRGNGIQYWALGGEHRREFTARTPAMIHYPGATLARNPQETGDYGFSLVEVNEYGRIKVDLIKASPLRWTAERIAIQEEMTEEQILGEMRARVKNLRDVLAEDTILMITWEAEASGAVLQELRYGNLAQTILRDLRADFSREVPVVYSLDIKPVLPDSYTADLYDQQTILGDYLRMLHFYQENPSEKIDTRIFFSQELRDYLEVKAEMERLQKAQAANKDLTEGPLTETVLTSSVDIRSFRPEAEILTDLLLLESERDPDVPAESDEMKTDRHLLEIHKKRMERRAAVLREAAMTGIELLSVGEESPSSPTRKNGGPHKNPLLLQERRQFLQDSDDKENRS